jgi:hypothetical protein
MWEAMDGGSLVVSKAIPQGWLDYRLDGASRMVLTEG